VRRNADIWQAGKHQQSSASIRAGKISEADIAARKQMRLSSGHGALSSSSLVLTAKKNSWKQVFSGCE
jgi:hypothetical protein